MKNKNIIIQHHVPELQIWQRLLQQWRSVRQLLEPFVVDSICNSWSSIHLSWSNTAASPVVIYASQYKQHVKSFAINMDPHSDKDLWFCSPQPEAQLCCKTMDMGLMHLLFGRRSWPQWHYGPDIMDQWHSNYLTV